ncbi:MAG: HD-GYP domain-containing protein [Muricoprocola sp.]
MNTETKKDYHLIEDNLIKEVSHGINVSNLAYKVAKQLALPEDVCYNLAVAGMVHDVGKQEMIRNMNRKEEKETLRVEEMKYIRTHPALGYMILKDQGYPEELAKWVLYHHENYDGTGYPANKAGEDIPLGARILRVCDVYCALTTERTYRKAYSSDEALKLMIEEVKYFDIKVFLALMQVVNE